MVVWLRFEDENKNVGFGTLENDVITEYAGDMLAKPTKTGRTLRKSAVKLLAPIEARNIYALWNNFFERQVFEKGQVPKVPLYFMKPTSSVVGPGVPIMQPKAFSGKVVHEAELGIIIGKECREVSEQDAAKYVFGYTCVNDVTAGPVLGAMLITMPSRLPCPISHAHNTKTHMHTHAVEDKTFKQWTRSKGFDTFTPMGPVIVTDVDPHGWRVKAVVDGAVKQDYPVNDMIFTPHKIISMLSHYQTLLPGDVISCGTSLGASRMLPGMKCDIVIDAIGTLTNPFAEHKGFPSKL